MAVDSLKTHLIEELTDLRDAEQQLIKALPRLAKAASAKPLKTALAKHLRETRAHVTRLDRALRGLGERPASKTCKGMKGLLGEGDTMMNKTPEGALRDAVIITGAQKVEHYEMASYGTARTYAQVLGEAQVARLLQQTLKEEKAADLTLTAIAERSVNEDAAEEWTAQEEENNGLLQQSAEWMTSTVRSTAQSMRRTLGSNGGSRSSARKAASTRTRRRSTSRRG
jgi:ferritin-like metal-binding protein YciE